MGKIRINRVFVFGAIAPVAAIVLYIVVYSALTSASRNLNGDWMFRLSASAVAMMLPSIVVFVLAIREARRKSLSTLSKVGVGIAALALMLVARPLLDGILRSKQERNMAMNDVAAPAFEATDLDGNAYRLSEQRGKIVLVNRWATWCGPCLVEMPELDQLFKERKEQGLVVFGLSDQAIATQKRFLQKVPVTYPLLAVGSGVPGFYRDIARFPASFLIDRQGRLHAIPVSEDAFAGIKTEVDRLLAEKYQP